jgi:Type II secretion system (T2SS), protein E, N-terminal domain
MPLPASVLKMRDLLLRAKVVDEYQMRSALAHLEQWGGRLPKVLAELGMVDEEQVTQVVAAGLRLPVQSLSMLQTDAQALGRLDPALCEQHGVFPVSLNTRTHTLVLAMADPTALDVVDLVASRAGARVQVVVASESHIVSAIQRHYRGLDPASTPPPNLARRAVTAEMPEADGPLELMLDDRAPPAPVASRPPSANTLLDELLGDEVPRTGFTPEQLKQLGELQRRQEQTTIILQAVLDLLADKGLR